ncbi:MAG: 4-hydroxy-3-methylbut-2-enyl diphosphate reductase [Candidatus Lindowbacteria bacterium]|nr:4-hydroxy-3-methylbut-2-enyl diphosphate reductase [Candidatus Lindowbacteria bacterium]
MTDQKLKVLLAAPRGFCAGVDRAIEIVEETLKIFGPPIYVKHEIVHNKHVVERLRKKGTIFVENVSDIPDDSVAIFSAHGVSKAVRAEAKKRPIRVIDATCPLVTKVHLEVHRLDSEDFEIFLIGHAGHVEVEGTMGQLPEGKIRLIQNAAEAELVQVTDPNKVGFVTQTTLSLDETNAVVTVLKRRFPEIQSPAKDDICYATQNRQNAIKGMVSQIDLLLVIGSKNSSNSNRLVDVALANGVPGYLFDQPDEIQKDWFKDVKCVGLTAGASAPEDLVQASLNHILDNYGGIMEHYVYKEESVSFALPIELLQPASN